MAKSSKKTPVKKIEIETPESNATVKYELAPVEKAATPAKTTKKIKVENKTSAPKKTQKVVKTVKTETPAEKIEVKSVKKAKPTGKAASKTKAVSKSKTAAKNVVVVAGMSIKVKATLIALGAALAVGGVGGVVIFAMSQNKKSYCTVEYQANGGSETSNTQVVCGGRVKAPTDPTRDGFEFAGWTYRGEIFNFEDDSVDTNITLIAKWNLKEDEKTNEEISEAIEEITGKDESTNTASGSTSKKTTTTTSSSSSNGSGLVNLEADKGGSSANEENKSSSSNSSTGSSTTTPSVSTPEEPTPEPEIPSVSDPEESEEGGSTEGGDTENNEEEPSTEEAGE